MLSNYRANCIPDFRSTHMCSAGWEEGRALWKRFGRVRLKNYSSCTEHKQRLPIRWVIDNDQLFERARIGKQRSKVKTFPPFRSVRWGGDSCTSLLPVAIGN